ncbi:MAG: helix-turn-helix transcriptional regulator [Lachnospiraceae bacterium]
MIPQLKENRTHGTKSYPYEQYYMRNIHHAFQFPVHWHEEIEIIYVEEGKLHVKIGEQDMDGEAGDLFFVNPRELHLMSSPDGKVKYYTLLFPIEFISFQSLDELEANLIAPIRSNQMMLPEQLTDEALKKKVREILVKMIADNREIHHLDIKEIGLSSHHLQTRIYLLQILQMLYEAGALTKAETAGNSNMQKELLGYIQNHYTEKITLSMLAEEFHLSEKYISRYFVEHFYLPFSNYVVHLRLTHAKQLLETTDESITEIALQSGFSNVSYFIRAFKNAYDKSPLKYRKEIRGEGKKGEAGI